MGILSKVAGAFGGNDAKDAAQAAAQAYRDAGLKWESATDESLKRFDPYQRAGRLGANALIDGYASGNFDPFRADPGYEFAREQGMRAVDSSGAARGMTLSGAQLKALNRFGTGMADQTYGNWFNRNMNLANLGLNTANSQANTQMTGTQGITNAITGQGQAKASGYLAEGGIKSGIGNSLLDFGLNKFL